MTRRLRSRSRRFGVLCVAALGCAGVASCISERSTAPVNDANGCTAQLPPSAFGSTIVVIRNFAFTPADVHVRAGTSVTWVNCDAAGNPSHTSTADGGAWSTPLLDPGAVVTVPFSTLGSFPYHCEPHPFMTGRVVVE